MKVKDQNGEEFTFDESTIAKISGDIYDADQGGNGTAVRDEAIFPGIKDDFHLTITDTNGKLIDKKTLNALVQNHSIVALDVSIEGSHTGENYNGEVYYEDSMEEDCVSFVRNFRKPLLKNHNMYSEPLGRTKDVSFGPSRLTDDRFAMTLVEHVTDQDAIIKFLDGRYRTVSISGTAKTVVCNKCNRKIVKNGTFNFCGHWRGRTYDGKRCTWGFRDIDYDEVSVVNGPADAYAQVTNIVVYTNKEEEKKMDGVANNNNPEQTQQGTSVQDNTDTQQGANSEFAKLFDSFMKQYQGQQSVNSNPQNDAGVDNGVQDNNGGTTTETVESALAKLKDMTEKYNAAVKDLNTANEKVTDLEGRLSAANQNVTTLQDMNVSFATQLKDVYIENIVETELKNGKLVMDNKESRTTELKSKSMTELTTLKAAASQVTDAATTQSSTNIPTLSNPALANPQNPAQTTDSVSERKIKNVNDWAEEIVGLLHN